MLNTSQEIFSQEQDPIGINYHALSKSEQISWSIFAFLRSVALFSFGGATSNHIGIFYSCCSSCNMSVGCGSHLTLQQHQYCLMSLALPYSAQSGSSWMPPSVRAHKEAWGLRVDSHEKDSNANRKCPIRNPFLGQAPVEKNKPLLSLLQLQLYILVLILWFILSPPTLFPSDGWETGYFVKFFPSCVGLHDIFN